MIMMIIIIIGDILKDKGDINLDNIKPIKFEIKGITS